LFKSLKIPFHGEKVKPNQQIHQKIGTSGKEQLKDKKKKLRRKYIVINVEPVAV
jgi:hypothetical protein